MNENKLGQEPAFPLEADRCEPEFGMSKRFYAACAAMQGLSANPATIKDLSKVSKETGKNVFEIMSKLSFELADELLKQENS